MHRDQCQFVATQGTEMYMPLMSTTAYHNDLSIPSNCRPSFSIPHRLNVSIITHVHPFPFPSSQHGAFFLSHHTSSSSFSCSLSFTLSSSSVCLGVDDDAEYDLEDRCGCDLITTADRLMGFEVCERVRCSWMRAKLDILAAPSCGWV